MLCPACDSENPDAARFCAMCGSRLAATCTSCQADLTPGARFCTSCGEEARPAVAAAGTAPATLHRPLAERRRITVLFVDLADFTTIAESMDPEDVRRIQSRYFEVSRSVIAGYGGTIEKFIGDAVMAVWGAPAAHEDDAQRAVRAALALVYAVDRLGSSGSPQPLRARAAITTGEAAVTVGAVGQGMVTGDLVNVAARLQTLAPTGGVLVDEATRELATAAGRFEPVGPLTLKGRSGHVSAYRVAGVEPEPVARQAGAHTGPFLGREREWRELTDLVSSVMREGRSRLVSITGIAGIGKSRLAWELGNWVDALEEDVAWHDGQSLAYGEGVAFAAVAQMVRRRIRVAEDTPPELARRQLATALEEYVADDSERRWIEPRLATLVARESVEAFDRDELFAAWRRFFERIAERMPVILVFEDLQWADASLLAFIEHLVTWARQRPIAVVTLARPEFLDRTPSWGTGMGAFTAIHLERLPDEAMQRLLASRAPQLVGDVVRHILDRAGGVPLYAVEVARMLEQRQDQQAAERRRSGQQPARRAAIDVPDSLQGLIAARIDSLPGAERRLLLAAAVLGPRFRPDALIALTGGEPTLIRDQIARLMQREMLTLDEELNSPGRGELAFVQDLVREVAYQTLAHSERRALHLSAARYLEGFGDDAAEPLAAHLAEAHRLTSDPREGIRLARRAVAALRHAAQQASLLHVPDRALGLLERALRMSQDAHQRPALLEEAADAARGAGRLDVAEQHLRELATMQIARRQRHAAARTRARLAAVLLSAQRNEAALAELESAIRSARGWEKDPGGIELAAQLARARSVLGQDREALAWADKALAAAQRLDLELIAIDLLVTRGTARVSLGEADAGLGDLRRAIARSQEANSLHTELRARNNLAWWLLGDDPRAALETARAGFDLATAMGLGELAIPLADVACTASVETGDWAWALATIDDLAERGMSDEYRIVLAATAAVIGSLRGDAAPLAPIETLGPLPEDTDAQVLASVQHAQAWAAFVSGDFVAARRLAEAAIEGFVGSDAAYQRALATRASLWLGDAALAAVSLGHLAGSAERGRASAATSLTLRAGLHALGAADEADAEYRRALEAWTTLDLPLQRALCLLDRYRLLGDAGVDAAAALDGLGAQGLLGLIEPPTGSGAAHRATAEAQPRASLRPS